MPQFGDMAYERIFRILFAMPPDPQENPKTRAFPKEIKP